MLLSVLISLLIRGVAVKCYPLLIKIKWTVCVFQKTYFCRCIASMTLKVFNEFKNIS